MHLAISLEADGILPSAYTLLLQLRQLQSYYRKRVKYCTFGLAGFAYFWNPWFRGLIPCSLPALSIHFTAVCLCVGLYVLSFTLQIFPVVRVWHLVLWYITSGFCLVFFGPFMFMMQPLMPFWFAHLLAAHVVLFALLDKLEAILLTFLGNASCFLLYLTLGNELSKHHLLLLYVYAAAALLYLSKSDEGPSKLALAEMESKLETCMEFIKYVSHELRLPLQGIRGVSDLLAQAIESKSTQEKLRYVNVIRASCSQLIMVASNALDLSKFQSRHCSVDRKECSFNLLLEEVVSEFEALSMLNNTQVTIYCPKVTISIDALKVRHVLRNLLANALAHTKGGKVNIQAFFVKGSMLQVSVLDTGTGIPAEKLDSIFEQRGTEDGSGLGLALVSQFVKLHGGSLWVENNVPHGSIFSFTLHLPDIEGIADKDHFAGLENGEGCIFWENVTEHTISLVNAWSEGSPIGAIIVDDDELSLLSSKLVMEGLGFVVSVARNCLEARQLIAREKVPLVLLDVIIGGEDLRECISNLHRDSGTLSIILQSGLSQGINAFKGRGVIAYLTKPYGISEVKKILAAIKQV